MKEREREAVMDAVADVMLKLVYETYVMRCPEGRPRENLRSGPTRVGEGGRGGNGAPTHAPNSDGITAMGAIFRTKRWRNAKNTGSKEGRTGTYSRRPLVYLPSVGV